jgi:hypothetical protein
MAQKQKKIYSNKEVLDWAVGKARTAAGYRKNIMKTTEKMRDFPMTGKMYFFWYDPKYKAVLPIYDRFPLVLPIDFYMDGFLGLNLHYLKPIERETLLDRLLSYRNNNYMDESTKLRLSYELLSRTRRISNLARPCIKRYLYSHVQSSFVQVPADEWELAVNLPVQFFVEK